jgi:hypothetical protein
MVGVILSAVDHRADMGRAIAGFFGATVPA